MSSVPRLALERLYAAKLRNNRDAFFDDDDSDAEEEDDGVNIYDELVPAPKPKETKPQSDNTFQGTSRHKHRQNRVRRKRAEGVVGSTSLNLRLPPNMTISDAPSLSATASSAPTGGRERSNNGNPLPVCPNCSHRRQVQRLCYWELHKEWVYVCGFEGPIDDPVVCLREKMDKHIQSMVDAQFGITDPILLATSGGGKRSSKKSKQNMEPTVPAYNMNTLTLNIAKPLAFTLDGNASHLTRYFCGYRWRQGRKMPICEQCYSILGLNIKGDNEPMYWCKACEDFSC